MIQSSVVLLLFLCQLVVKSQLLLHSHGYEAVLDSFALKSYLWTKDLFSQRIVLYVSNSPQFPVKLRMRTNPNEAKPTFGQKCFPLSQTSDLQ